MSRADGESVYEETGDDGEPAVGSTAREQVGLCLSGGGYRAMLFHLGVVRQLNLLGLLRELDRVSSVSGGSITAGTLGCHWQRLSWDARGSAENFDEVITSRLRALAGLTIDVEAGFGGIVGFAAAAERVAARYREVLVDDATTDDLPLDTDGPRFVLNAANLQTGALFRFSRPYMGDWKLGLWYEPRFSLARAMAASSAFPPVLSPLTLLAASPPRDGDAAFARDHADDLPELARRIELTDGGVYDNFGLETVHKRCKTVLVSDAGMRAAAQASPRRDWFSRLLRVRELFDDQVRSLRLRWLADSIDGGRNDGVYFSIRGEVVTRQSWSDGDAARASDRALADVPTRLAALKPEAQEALIDWGQRHTVAALSAAKRQGALPVRLASRIA